jgi:shikimate kinase
MPPSSIPYPTIVVTGNIASGKSTLSKGLAAALPGVTYVCMDRLRMELQGELYGKNPVVSERLCERTMLDRLRSPGTLLYESSGTTTLFTKAWRLIHTERKGTVAVIRTECMFATAMARFDLRKLQGGTYQVKPPYSGRDTIEDCWHRFNERRKVSADLVINTDVSDVEDTLHRSLVFLKTKGIMN